MRAGMVWQLLLKFQINPVQAAALTPSQPNQNKPSAPVGNAPPKSSTNIFDNTLEWVNNRLQPVYKADVPIMRDFTFSLQDGKILLALIHSLDPSKSLYFTLRFNFHPVECLMCKLITP